MFLAHFSGEGFTEILKKPIKETYFWYTEAVKLHNKLNEEKKGD